MSSKLQDARLSREWSQARLVIEIERLAHARGLVIMGRVSLKTAISRWENGHLIPGNLYRQLLRELLALREDEFAGQRVVHEDTDTNVDLRERLSRSSGLDTTVHLALQAQTDHLRQLDRRLGAPLLLDQMRAHLRALQDLLDGAVLGATRRPIASILADAAALAGWQAFDLGRTQEAWAMHELAAAAAREADEPAALAHSRGQQAFILLDLGQGGTAAQLLAETRHDLSHKIPARLLSWLYAAQAEAAATNSGAAECHRLLELARDALPSGPDDGELPYINLDECHLARWRGHSLALLGDPTAITDLEGALASMSPDFQRARAGLQVNLALAYQAAGVTDLSDKYAAGARRTIQQTGSVRQRTRLAQLAA